MNNDLSGTPIGEQYKHWTKSVVQRIGDSDFSLVKILFGYGKHVYNTFPRNHQTKWSSL
jgi:hypothetical protein